MSLAEDIECYYNPFEEDNYDDSIFKDYLLGKLSWKCKDGSRILVTRMTESHILNCIRIPLYPNKENWDIVFNYELRIRKHK